MFNLNQVVEAFEGITVTVGKDAVMLEGMTYIDLYEFICTLSDKEAAELVEQLEDKLGKKVTGEIMTTVIAIADGIEDFLARPSKASMLLYIKESDVLNKSIYRKSGRNVTTSGKSSYVEYKDFVIDSDMQIFIDDVQYSIPYDVNIQVSSITRDGQKEYSYIATWIMDDINSIAEVDNPYIKIYKASYDGDICYYINNY